METSVSEINLCSEKNNIIDSKTKIIPTVTMSELSFIKTNENCIRKTTHHYI